MPIRGINSQFAIRILPNRHSSIPFVLLEPPHLLFPLDLIFCPTSIPRFMSPSVPFSPQPSFAPLHFCPPSPFYPLHLLSPFSSLSSYTRLVIQYELMKLRWQKKESPWFWRQMGGDDIRPRPIIKGGGEWVLTGYCTYR